MSLSVLSAVFTGANQSGTIRPYGVSGNQRYNRIPNSQLSSLGLSNALSSATLYSSSTAHNTLLLFGMPQIPWLSFGDYNGQFLQLTNASSGAELDVNLSAYGFDNAPTSALLVATRRGTEFRLSFRDLFLSKWNTVIDGKLSSEAKRDVEPVLT